MRILLSPAFFIATVALIVTPNGVQAQDNWGMTCGGKGNFLDISVMSCPSIHNCKLDLMETYDGTIRFRPRKDHNQLQTSVTLLAQFANLQKLSFVGTHYRYFESGQTYTQSFQLMFGPEFFASVGPHIARIEIKDGEDQEICYHFTIKSLNTTVNLVNPEGRMGDFCTWSPAPCAFPNSVCLPMEGRNLKQCSCAAYAEQELNDCKKTVGQSCHLESDCVSHSACRNLTYIANGTCACEEGFREDEANRLCVKGGGTYLGYSLFLVAVLKLFVFSNK